MKGFTKLALVSAIAALPVSGFAMEAMDDSSLSAVTGQDGISISLGTEITADIIIHDKDGYSAPYNGAGAIVLSGFGLTFANNATDRVVVNIDAGSQAAGDAVLNINVATPANMTLALGDLQVAASNGASGTGNWGLNGGAVTVANLGSLTLGATSLNIQLGSEPQGNMIDTTATITGGVTLTNFALIDAGGLVSGGSINMSSLSITNASGDGNLNVEAGIDVSASALVIDVVTMGTGGADLRIANLKLGDAGTAATVGDIEISGLDLTGTISVSGK